ncbi:MAG: hypothetical protein K2K57_03115 [Oscillospiraceae bacterium]|nr:hypothetical protein [Oscillospiraceae bacterium]
MNFISRKVLSDTRENEVFGFVMKAYVMAHYITVKRFPINLRTAGSVKLVFSWLGNDTSNITEHKCIIEIGNQIVADPMTCTVVCST